MKRRNFNDLFGMCSGGDTKGAAHRCAAARVERARTTKRTSRRDIISNRLSPRRGHRSRGRTNEELTRPHPRIFRQRDVYALQRVSLRDTTFLPKVALRERNKTRPKNLISLSHARSVFLSAASHTFCHARRRATR